MTEPFVQKSKSFLQIDKWTRLNSQLKVGFTTRIGGYSVSPYKSLNMGFHVSDEKEIVVQNRRNLSDIISMPLDLWICGKQTHETNVMKVDKGSRGKGATSYETSLNRTDSLITREKGILCTALFADCVPLYFFDPISGYIGIAHAGWKGTVNKIAEKTIKKLCANGVHPSDLQVAIGPSISKDNYEVDDRIISKLKDSYIEKCVTKKENNRYLLDLKQLNVEILLQNGIHSNNIEITSFCTYTNENLFFSHRRDHGMTGRMLGFIGYTKN